MSMGLSPFSIYFYRFHLTFITSTPLCQQKIHTFPQSSRFSITYTLQHNAFELPEKILLYLDGLFDFILTGSGPLFEAARNSCFSIGFNIAALLTDCLVHKYFLRVSKPSSLKKGSNLLLALYFSK